MNRPILLFLAAFVATASASGVGRYIPQWDSVDNREEKENQHQHQQQRDLQSSVNRVTGMVYECLPNDLPKLPLKGLRDYQPGSIIRLCIAPEVPTANRGIAMRYVDDFSLTGQDSNLRQLLVSGKNERYDTLSLCIKGQLVCSLKVRLLEELFWSNTPGESISIRAQGYVTMEYRASGFALNNLADTEIPVSVNINVTGIAPPPGVVLQGGNEIDCDWWCQTPMWFRVFVIILAILVLCCICGLCATSCCVVKEMLDEDKEQKEDREALRKEREAKEEEEEQRRRY